MKRQLVILSLVLAAGATAFALPSEDVGGGSEAKVTVQLAPEVVGTITEYLNTPDAAQVVKALSLPSDQTLTAASLKNLKPSQTDALSALAKLNVENAAIQARIVKGAEGSEVSSFLKIAQTQLKNSLAETGGSAWTDVQRSHLVELVNNVLAQAGRLTNQKVEDSLKGYNSSGPGIKPITMTALEAACG